MRTFLLYSPSACLATAAVTFAVCGRTTFLVVLTCVVLALTMVGHTWQEIQDRRTHD